MYATLALVGGRCHTLDPSQRVVPAVAIAGTRILAAGSRADIEPHIGPDTRIIELEGKSVFPGFIDAHTHWEVTAHIRRVWVDATLETPERVIELLRAEVEKRAPGEWIIISGGFLSQLPTKALLDEIAPENPVLIRRTMHVQMANSLAFSMSGLSADNPQPMPGCRLEIGDDGEFTGFVEDAFDLFAVTPPSSESLTDAMMTVAHELFLANGITTIHDMPASQAGTRLLQRMHRSDDLPLRVVMYPILPPVHRSGPALEQYAGIGLESGFGDDWLRFGGVKLFVDGHERAAARSEEMAADTSRQRLPLLGRTYEELVALVVQAMRSGIQLRMHAWGDYAQRQALDAVKVAARASGRSDHRTRLEHMLNAGYPDIGLEEVRDAGIVPVPQASFLLNDEPDAAKSKYVFRDAIDAGLVFANSSDCTGSQPTLVSPWVGIAAMLDRTNRNGEVIDSSQRVTLDEALRSYTGGSAYAASEEDQKGSLEPNKLADLVVVDANPYDLEPSDIARISTVTTIIGGEIAYQRGAEGN
jgi:predicted amidohydrolase YtcJ